MRERLPLWRLLGEQAFPDLGLVDVVLAIVDALGVRVGGEDEPLLVSRRFDLFDLFVLFFLIARLEAPIRLFLPRVRVGVAAGEVAKIQREVVTTAFRPSRVSSTSCAARP
jgi:hypothetical protein